LSRWHVAGCANCQTHLEARVAFGTHALSAAVAAINSDQITVEVRTRDGLLGEEPQHLAAMPFVYFFGRADFTVSYFGANIYPERVDLEERVRRSIKIIVTPEGHSAEIRRGELSVNLSGK
jgi:hypothetical protein